MPPAILDAGQSITSTSWHIYSSLLYNDITNVSYLTTSHFAISYVFFTFKNVSGKFYNSILFKSQENSNVIFYLCFIKNYLIKMYTIYFILFFGCSLINILLHCIFYIHFLIFPSYIFFFIIITLYIIYIKNCSNNP